MKRSSTPDDAGGGFTLVELLATLAVIAVLAGVLFAALSAGRARATEANDLSRLRQMGVIAQTWASENHGQLPTTPHGGYAWYVNLWRYTNGMGAYPKEATLKGSIFWRPTFDGSPASNLGLGVGYGLNARLTDANAWRLSAIAKPAAKVLIGSVEKGDGIWPGVAAGGWNRVAAPYDGKASILYVDGHVGLALPSGLTASRNFELNQ